MKVGPMELETGTVDEAALRSSTGCTVERMRGMLARPMLAGTVAAALLACVKDGPVRSDLAREIAKAGCDEIRLKVLALYTKRKGRARGKN